MVARCVMLLTALQSVSASQEPLPESCSPTEDARPDQGMAALQSRSKLKYTMEVHEVADFGTNTTDESLAEEALLFRELLSDRSFSQATRTALSSASRLQACAQRDFSQQDDGESASSHKTPRMTKEKQEEMLRLTGKVGDMEELKSDDCETKTKEVKKETEKLVTSIKKIKGEITTRKVEVTTIKESLTTKLKEIKKFQKHVKHEEKKCEDKIKETEKEIQKVEKELNVIGQICYKRTEVNLDISKTNLLQTASLDTPDEVHGNLSEVSTSIMATKHAVSDLAQCRTRETKFLEEAVDEAPAESVVEEEAPDAAQVAAANTINSNLLQVVKEGPACLPNAVDFDFRASTLLSNNLGGQGPATGAQEIRFGSIGTLNAKPLDIAVTVTNADYAPNNNIRNGLNGAFGQVNVKPNSRAELTFEFQDTATKAPVTVPEFYFSFFDIDHGKQGSGVETLILPNVEKFYFTKKREFNKTYSKGTLTLTSTHEGHGCDNPTDPMDLGNITCEENTVVRSRRSVTLEYTHRTRFTAIFSAGGKAGGRNILFAGRSSLVKNCVNKTREIRGAPTDAHCLQEEKEFEKKCEDLTKQITRTKVIKQKQREVQPCKKLVETEWESMKLVQVEVEELTKKLNKEVKIIEELKPGLEKVEKTKKKFVHIYNETIEECKPIKIDELEEVIKSMEGCPGLEEDVYGPPEWIGWARVEQRRGMPVDELDALLSQACSNKFGANTARRVRAAEVSEILASTIKNLPVKNEGELPILPTCPLCISKNDAEARICWKEDGAPLTAKGESGNCRQGPKHAMCVYAR